MQPERRPAEEMVLWKRQQRPALPWILPVDLMYEIFLKFYLHNSRGNTRALGRLKCVCRAWRDLLHSPLFVLHMHFPLSRKARPYIALSTYSSCNDQTEPVFRDQEPKIDSQTLITMSAAADTITSPPHFGISSTCNGLLLCVQGREPTLSMHSDRSDFRVVNPLTKEKTDLTPLFHSRTEHLIVKQLLWDSSSTSSSSATSSEPPVGWGTYKVLLVYQIQQRRKFHYVRTLAFTLGEDSSWRSISCPTGEWGAWSSIHCAGNTWCLEAPCLGGAAHFVVESMDPREGGEKRFRVGTFHIKHERFGSFAFPHDQCFAERYKTTASQLSRKRVALLELRGSLALLHLDVSGLALHTWWMIDYNGREWVKEASVGLSFLWPSSPAPGDGLWVHSIQVVVKSDDDRVLVLLSFQTEELKYGHNPEDGVFVSYHPWLGTAEKVEREQINPVVFSQIVYHPVRWGYAFGESMVPLRTVAITAITTTATS